MVTTGILPLQGKIPMVEPGIEPGTSWLIVRSSDHQTTRLVNGRMAKGVGLGDFFSGSRYSYLNERNKNLNSVLII